VPDSKPLPPSRFAEFDARRVREVCPLDPPPATGKVKVMAGERELTTGMLSKDANFRLVVSGPIGVKEIERLIKKLEIDKDILAEQEYLLGDGTDEAASKA
jgi:hypothetical protein